MIPKVRDIGNQPMKNNHKIVPKLMSMKDMPKNQFRMITLLEIVENHLEQIIMALTGIMPP